MQQIKPVLVEDVGDVALFVVPLNKLCARAIWNSKIQLFYKFNSLLCVKKEFFFFPICIAVLD